MGIILLSFAIAYVIAFLAAKRIVPSTGPPKSSAPAKPPAPPAAVPKPPAGGGKP